ncbi:hypothetical protein [Chitinophaga agri]|uniref:Uncharacterized protein n=1 Tax=Chitinophaga agri TaxID=2703787 RepID=A0A6B9ZNM7_9BACT|nr:hypothetical protein [Chitinophaga agri]QHS63489.1 hypothetical protein GWR21_29060 [Chitinophaga agri]
MLISKRDPLTLVYQKIRPFTDYIGRMYTDDVITLKAIHLNRGSQSLPPYITIHPEQPDTTQTVVIPGEIPYIRILGRVMESIPPERPYVPENRA